MKLKQSEKVLWEGTLNKESKTGTGFGFGWVYIGSTYMMLGPNRR